MTERIDQLRSEAEAAIAGAASAAELEELRIRFLGRKAELPQLLRGVRDLPAEERGPIGQAANEARRALEALIAARAADLDAAELDARLGEDRVDITLPGDPLDPIGRVHLITQTRREIEDVFLGLGFDVAEGPEVETVYYNFDALNHAPNHPAREWTDTFYVSEEVLLRTHTSPVQIRAMEQQPPPLYIVMPGRVYRPDSDATHTPQFHQIEGLAVDADITPADPPGTPLAFARAVFCPEREGRMRPHFFPFTETSVEVDVSCFRCGGTGQLADGSRCPLCKGERWIEILGAGMVHPNVFDHVRERGYDAERIQGFAFGMGIERIAMLKHEVPDLRLFYDNDVRFVEQFG